MLFLIACSVRILWVTCRMRQKIILPQVPFCSDWCQPWVPQHVASHIPCPHPCILFYWGGGGDDRAGTIPGPPFREKAEREAQNWHLLGVLSVNTSPVRSALTSFSYCTWKTSWSHRAGRWWSRKLVCGLASVLAPRPPLVLLRCPPSIVEEDKDPRKTSTISEAPGKPPLSPPTNPHWLRGSQNAVNWCYSLLKFPEENKYNVVTVSELGSCPASIRREPYERGAGNRTKESWSSGSNPCTLHRERALSKVTAANRELEARPPGSQASSPPRAGSILRAC